MNRFALPCLAIALAVGAYAGGGTSASAQVKKVVNIGTAGIGGGWYPTGGFVCNLVNKSRETYGHQIRCTVESTGGTVANIRSIYRGDLEVAFSVSNGLYDAYHGKRAYEDLGPMEDLRFVMSFHNDYQYLVARADSGIEHFRDIKGKRVNTAAAASGSKVIAHRIMDYLGIASEDLALETSLTAREQAQALCDNKVDAYFYETGIGAATIQEASNTCDVVIAAIDGPEIDKLVKDFPFYTKGTIPGGFYRGNPDDIPTFAEPTVLVATSKLDGDVVYYIVKAVMDNYEDFKKQSSLFTRMEREASVKNGRSGVPYHEGAARYFKEVGLLE